MANKTGIQIEIIPNMYEMGFFKKTLSSRSRLRLTTLCAIALLALLFFAAGYFIHYYSVWSGLNIIIIIFLLLNSIWVAYLVALTFGDTFFSGPWRKKMILGSKFIPDDIEEQKALLKNKNIYFLLAWGLAIPLLCFGCDLCTGRHISWYQNIGGTIISLQSPDETERLYSIKTISNAFYSKKWSDEQIREKTLMLLHDDNDEIKSWAAYLAGRAKMIDGADDLISLLKSPDTNYNVRCEAAIALGKMDWKPARADLFSTIKSTFAQNHNDKALIPSALYALFSMDDSMAAQESMQILNTCLNTKDCSSEVLQYAFFYLKSRKVKAAAEIAFNYLNSADISDEIRCYASDILRFTASKQDVPQLKEQFSKAPENLECPVVYRKFHAEPAVILFEHDTLRALFLRSVGNIEDPNDYDWIWLIGSNSSIDLHTRKVAETYTKAMREKGLVK